jgi:transposase
MDTLEAWQAFRNKRVRRITRRKYTAEEKTRIVLEGFRHEVPIRDLCRREGIKPKVYYAWLRDFMEAGKTRLSRDTVRDATGAEADDLRRENERLKQLVADLSLQAHILILLRAPKFPVWNRPQAYQCPREVHGAGFAG